MIIYRFRRHLETRLWLLFIPLVILTARVSTSAFDTFCIERFNRGLERRGERATLPSSSAHYVDSVTSSHASTFCSWSCSLFFPPAPTRTGWRRQRCHDLPDMRLVSQKRTTRRHEIPPPTSTHPSGASWLLLFDFAFSFRCHFILHPLHADTWNSRCHTNNTQESK